MNQEREIEQLRRRVGLLERENRALTRELYGDTSRVVLTDEQYLAALLATKTFRWSAPLREVWGRVLLATRALRGQPVNQPNPCNPLTHRGPHRTPTRRYILGKPTS